jgi:hypothetical protein
VRTVFVQVISNELGHLTPLLDILRKCFTSEVEVPILRSKVLVRLNGVCQC